MLTAQEIEEWDIIQHLTKEEKEKISKAISETLKDFDERLKAVVEKKEEDQ